MPGENFLIKGNLFRFLLSFVTEEEGGGWRSKDDRVEF